MQRPEMDGVGLVDRHQDFVTAPNVIFIYIYEVPKRRCLMKN